MSKDRIKLGQVKKQLSGMSKEEKAAMKKATRGGLSLSEKQKKIKARVQWKIAGLTNKEKLKAMTPASVDKLLKEATAEIEAELEGNKK